MTFLASREDTIVQKLKFFKEYFMTVLASTRIFSKKKLNYFGLLSTIDVVFVNVRHIMNNGRFQGLPLDK